MSKVITGLDNQLHYILYTLLVPFDESPQTLSAGLLFVPTALVTSSIRPCQKCALGVRTVYEAGHRQRSWRIS